VIIVVVYLVVFCFFFFSSRRRHTRSKRDWSSDVSLPICLLERSENIGARRLFTIMERLLEEISFEAPEQTERKLTIDAQVVRNRSEERRVGQVGRNRREERRVGKKCAEWGGGDNAVRHGV